MLHLTFDLELHDPVKKLNEKAKEKFISEQEKILSKVFTLLNKNKVKISCFVTNEFVKSFYGFFHEYVVEKHEVGCHTANHFYYSRMNSEGFLQNIKKNKKYLERETGLKSQGFRAPGGLVPNDLTSILKKLDFKYDSSVVPGIMPGRFYCPNAPNEPYLPNFDNIFIPSKENREIIEFPLLTSKFIKLSMSGYFLSYYSMFIDLKKFEGKYSTVYLHPCDFKKFGIFDKSFIWDKIKITKFLWKFLHRYVQMSKNTDYRLYSLYIKEIDRLKTIAD